MSLNNIPIQRKLMTIILLTAGVVMVITCASFFAYRLLTFRQSAIRQLNVQGEIIAANSTASLAFENQTDAQEVLAALRAERHIVAACLYDKGGRLFSRYPADRPPIAFPPAPGADGFRFERSHLIGYQPIVQGANSRLGTLYLESDMGEMYELLRLYTVVALLVMIVSLCVAYTLSRVLQKQISQPILALADTAKAISNLQDYSVRAPRLGNDELGLLTDAFNQMLTRIQDQNREAQQSAEEIKQLNADLERRVAERTIQLEMTNKEIEAFSYSVSHDLRAPLRSIDGFSQALLEDYSDRLDDVGHMHLRRVRAATQRMGQLIDDMLNLSRITRAEMKHQMVDLSKLASGIAADLKQSDPNRKVDFVIADGVEACGDASLLKIVLENLLGNAWKFTSKHEEARIEFGMRDEDGEPVYFVRDDGAGFDQQYADKLFAAFQRLHAITEFAGTGIGLATVARIIHRHNGRVWAEGAVESGATFSFTL